MRNKKIAFLVSIGVFALVAGLMTSGAYADCGGAGTVLINCPDDDGSGTTGICHVLDLVVQIMTVGIGILGVIGIVITGIQYLTAGGSEEKTRKSKRRMLELVIGLALYVSLASVVAWLNPGGLFCQANNGNGANGGASSSGSASGDTSSGGSGSTSGGASGQSANDSDGDGIIDLPASEVLDS